VTVTIDINFNRAPVRGPLSEINYIVSELLEEARKDAKIYDAKKLEFDYSLHDSTGRKCGVAKFRE
jgi:hypothetical protein